MKILHFLDTVNRGGAETLVLDVCRNAHKAGIELLFACAGGGALEKDFLELNITKFRLKRRLPFDPLLAFALRDILTKEKVEIIHTHQAVEALHALAAAFGTKTKVVLTHHGIVPDKKNLVATKWLLPRVAHNILVGRESKKIYESEFAFRFPPNTSVIYNGVDEQRLKPSGKNFREQLNLGKSDFVFGMIGHFYREPRKDQLTLCRALPSLFTKISNANCVFVGKTMMGAEEKFNECVKFCGEFGLLEKVHFLGGRDDIPDILAALDVFVLSSLAEGLPIAVNEAMLASVPSVVSDIPPLLEVSADGKYAEVFHAGDDKQLSETLARLLTDENARTNLAKSAREFALANFSIDAHLANLKQLYESLLNR